MGAEQFFAILCLVAWAFAANFASASRARIGGRTGTKYWTGLGLLYSWAVLQCNADWLAGGDLPTIAIPGLVLGAQPSLLGAQQGRQICVTLAGSLAGFPSLVWSKYSKCKGPFQQLVARAVLAAVRLVRARASTSDIVHGDMHEVIVPSATSSSSSSSSSTSNSRRRVRANNNFQGAPPQTGVFTTSCSSGSPWTTRKEKRNFGIPLLTYCTLPYIIPPSL